MRNVKSVFINLLHTFQKTSPPNDLILISFPFEPSPFQKQRTSNSFWSKVTICFRSEENGPLISYCLCNHHFSPLPVPALFPNPATHTTCPRQQLSQRDGLVRVHHGNMDRKLFFDRCRKGALRKVEFPAAVCGSSFRTFSYNSATTRDLQSYFLTQLRQWFIFLLTSPSSQLIAQGGGILLSILYECF